MRGLGFQVPDLGVKTLLALLDVASAPTVLVQWNDVVEVGGGQAFELLVQVGLGFA